MAAVPPLPSPPGQQELLDTGRLIKLVFTSLLRHVDARMQPMDLTAMQWEPLLLLALGRADTVAGLARECRVDCGAMTRMLDRLEQKRLLTRQRSELDRRVVNLCLTAKGRGVAGEIPQLVGEELRRHLQDISPQELHMLNRLLTKMVENGNGSTPVQEVNA
jgi:DNA-binding MarR family transcriptional regulator